MTFVDLFEFCNRKASKCRSINSRTNHSIFRWFFTPSLIVFGSFMLCLTYFVTFCDISFRFVSSFLVSFSFLTLVVPYVEWRSRICDTWYLYRQIMVGLCITENGCYWRKSTKHAIVEFRPMRSRSLAFGITTMYL